MEMEDTPQALAGALHQLNARQHQCRLRHRLLSLVCVLTRITWLVVDLLQASEELGVLFEFADRLVTLKVK